MPHLELQTIRQRHPLVQALGDLVRVFVRDKEPAAALASVAEIASPRHGALVTQRPDVEDVIASLLISDGAQTDAAPATLPVTGKEAPQDWGTTALIHANELVRDFGKFRAVDHVSLEVAPGKIFGLLGANGAGKTTVIKMLTGLLPPTSGTGEVAGAQIGRASQAIRERIGYMSQSFSLLFGPDRHGKLGVLCRSLRTVSTAKSPAHCGVDRSNRFAWLRAPLDFGPTDGHPSATGPWAAHWFIDRK